MLLLSLAIVLSSILYILALMSNDWPCCTFRLNTLLDLTSSIEYSSYIFPTWPGFSCQYQTCNRFLTIWCSTPLAVAARCKNWMVLSIWSWLAANGRSLRNATRMRSLRTYRAGPEYWTACSPARYKDRYAHRTWVEVLKDMISQSALGTVGVVLRPSCRQRGRWMLPGAMKYSAGLPQLGPRMDFEHQFTIEFDSSSLMVSGRIMGI